MHPDSDSQSRPFSGRFLFEPPDLRRLKKLDPRVPDLLVPSFCDVPFAELAERGIVHYCLDLDNTLALQTGHEPAPGVLEKLRWAREQGYIKNLCLLSNTIWGRHRVKRLARLAERLEIELFYPCRLRLRKPHPAAYRWALERMGAHPSTTATVGDQIYSDIVGGNRSGLFTILVRPLGADHWTTSVIGRRIRERLVLEHYGLRFEAGKGRTNNS